MNAIDVMIVMDSPSRLPRGEKGIVPRAFRRYDLYDYTDACYSQFSPKRTGWGTGWYIGVAATIPQLCWAMLSSCIDRNDLDCPLAKAFSWIHRQIHQPHWRFAYCRGCRAIGWGFWGPCPQGNASDSWAAPQIARGVVFCRDLTMGLYVFL